jgi:hypothetical protein
MSEHVRAALIVEIPAALIVEREGSGDDEADSRRIHPWQRPPIYAPLSELLCRIHVILYYLILYYLNVVGTSHN